MSKTFSDAAAMAVEDVVRLGTAGGARMLGLDGVGTLAVGMAADFAVYDLDEVVERRELVTEKLRAEVRVGPTVEIGEEDLEQVLSELPDVLSGHLLTCQQVRCDHRISRHRPIPGKNQMQ